jgi:hypothetical protein
VGSIQAFDHQSRLMMALEKMIAPNGPPPFLNDNLLIITINARKLKNLP